jgi:exonuclease III
MAQNHREQRIMTHNIRGINAPEKWDSLRSRIGESKCDIVYLQETKREYFDASYLQNFCSRQFDQFFFCPSIGASRGAITFWKGEKLHGEKIFEMVPYYYLCPSTMKGKMDFFHRFSNIHIP